MTDLRFAQPQWIHLIWLVLGAITILCWFEWKGDNRLSLFMSYSMRQRLVMRPSRLRRLMRIVLMGVCCICLVIALMRPQWGFQFVRSKRVGAEIMVCLDVSRSMLAADVAPSRLSRARAEIRDLLSFLDGDHIGLIAFAGKATVLCPLTPDFGFLRNVLETVGPHSVSRGGTNLEAPIRKALAGFRGSSDLSRTIILITDGEDHDSFVLDAAKAAAERGIGIITIGFGDEAGSELYVIDSETGARNQVRDGDGNPVITRLDGDMLRKISLETGSAYIPAGTATLDLKSIYDIHIAPLTRGQLSARGRMVKQEGFQWAIIGALVSMMMATMVTRGRQSSTPPTLAKARSAVAILMLMAAIVSEVSAQETEQAESEVTQTVQDEQSQLQGERAEEADPREAYNQAVAMLSAKQLDAAEEHLELARSHAGSDGQARYRACYNLGWVAVERAEEIIKEKPAEALAHLERAADWFREAIRLQQQEDAPRENLEIVTRRAMTLADSLANREKSDLAAKLDALIASQRALLDLMQTTVQQASTMEQPALNEALRREFRSLEIQQRQHLSQLGKCSQAVRGELDSIDKVEKAERTAEQRLRQVQLSNVLIYLNQASQRMGQSRSQMRLRQALRAYRRASASLEQMKRARDQLRNIVEVLTAVIGDAISLAQQTAMFSSRNSLAIAPDKPALDVPNWITIEYLDQTLESIQGRTDELAERIEAGAGEAVESEERRVKGEEERVAVMLREALPLLEQAQDQFGRARDLLTLNQNIESYQSQVAAIDLLHDVRELFLDIRGLIEVIYSDQRSMRQLTDLDREAEEQQDAQSLLTALGGLQSENLVRSRRLAEMFGSQLQELEQPTETAENGEKFPAEQQKQRLLLARQLLEKITTSFQGLSTRMEAPSEAGLDQITAEIDLSLEQLEDLRRLFFSIVEHLRETAQRQLELSDRTRDIIALNPNGEVRDRLMVAVAPVASRQDELSQTAQQIADALKKQSQQSPAQGVGGSAQEGSAQASQESAYRFSRAADHVADAKGAMDQAVSDMSTESLKLDSAQGHQSTASEQLLAALQLLQPPPPQDQQKNQQQQQDEQKQSERGDQDNSDQQQKQPQMTQQDMSHVLQAVRDREAQRRRERSQRPAAGYTPVEKDW